MKKELTSHFSGKEKIVEEIFNRLVARLKPFGPFSIEPHKTSIHLVSKFGFAGIYTRTGYLNIEFHLARKLKSDRILKVEQASANRFHHTIRVSSLHELDRELLDWLKEAYDLKS